MRAEPVGPSLEVLPFAAGAGGSFQQHGWLRAPHGGSHPPWRKDLSSRPPFCSQAPANATPTAPTGGPATPPRGSAPANRAWGASSATAASLASGISAASSPTARAAARVSAGTPRPGSPAVGKALGTLGPSCHLKLGTFVLGWLFL